MVSEKKVWVKECDLSFLTQSLVVWSVPLPTQDIPVAAVGKAQMKLTALPWPPGAPQVDSEWCWRPLRLSVGYSLPSMVTLIC